MNLVTAQLVNDAIASSQEDHAMKFQKLQQQVNDSQPKLTKLFEALDTDGTGDISLLELIRGVQKAADKLDLDETLLDLLKPQNLADNYDCFDTDDNGVIDQYEFVQGCLAMLTRPNTPMELLQVLQLARNTKFNLHMIEHKVEKLDRLAAQFETMGGPRGT